MRLLSPATTNAKTSKKLDDYNYEGAILYLSPHNLADGHHTVCPWSTPGCRATCLNTSGRAQVAGDLTLNNLQQYSIHKARVRKTLYYLNYSGNFKLDLEAELRRLADKAQKKGKKAVVRLNGTSDIAWENEIQLQHLNTIQFYDYTKSLVRMNKYLNRELPSNYYLIFSRSESTTDETIKKICGAGGNVAVVFRNKVPRKYLGINVINGDEHDFRFRNKPGRIIGLKAKGRAKKDNTGFVVDV